MQKRDWDHVGLSIRWNFPNSVGFLCLFSLLLLSCGGGSSSPPPPTQNPVPVVQSVSPATVGVGGPAFTLTVTGSNFVQTSVVQWNGANEPTTYVDSAHLTAAIPASAIPASTTGNLPITVTSPPPGGGSSNSVSVLVGYPLPAITSLNPSGVVLGSPAFTLTVNGANFSSGASVYLNGVSRVTQFVSSMQLTASILSSDLTGAAGNLGITVQDPSPSNGISNTFPLALQNLAPVISSVTPSSILAGNPTLITVIGSGFLTGATIQVGGQPFQTYSNPSGTETALITVPIGSLTLTVTNPSPTVGSSNGLTLTGTAAGPGAQLIVASIGPSGDILPPAGPPGGLSSTGRYFVFDTYLRDTCLGGPSGCVPSTAQFEKSLTLYASGVSSDGRYVASIGASGIYLTDSCTGAPSGCSQTSNLIPATQSDGTFFRMTSTARYISYATYLDYSTTSSAYIYDTCVGAPPGCTAAQIPVATVVPSSPPFPSDDGRYLIYIDANRQVSLHDACLGAPPGCSPSDAVISSAATAADSSPAISSDAQYVAYDCSSVGLCLQATCLGASPSCSSSPSGFGFPGYDPPAISIGGRFMAYDSALGMINGQPLANTMTFVFDSCNGAPSGCVQRTAPVCLNASGALANSLCGLGGMTFDGQYILIYSAATNLDPSQSPPNIALVSYITKNPLF